MHTHFLGLSVKILFPQFVSLKVDLLPLNPGHTHPLIALCFYLSVHSTRLSPRGQGLSVTLHYTWNADAP